MDASLIVAFVTGALSGLACGLAAGLARAAVAGGQASHVQEHLHRLEDQLRRSEEDRDLLGARLGEAREELARVETVLEHERRAADDKLAVVGEAQQRLADTFSVLSSQALERNAQSFLELATTRLASAQVEAHGELQRRQQAIEHLVAPLERSLGAVGQQLHELELARQEAYVGLSEQVRVLKESQEMLRNETANLVTALRAPASRGRWGELQLRRVVEMAGMVHHCDFVEQPGSGGPDGLLRPDLVVRLPGGKMVVIDAKTPLQAYLEAVEAPDEEARRRRLGDHARQVRGHVGKLAAKAYWQQFDSSPEFVVLFLPGDALLGGALEHDPGLMEHAVANQVLLATPVTLIALLRSVAYGWRQEALADNARAVCELGRELYRRLATMADHIAGVGKNLDRAVESYNKATGSLESRVLVTARRFVELGVAGEPMTPLDPIERSSRGLRAPEMAGAVLAIPGPHQVTEEPGGDRPP